MLETNTVGALLLKRARHTPNVSAYSYIEDQKWVTLSWIEFKNRVQNISFALLGLGVGKGDRVAFLSNSRIEQVICDVATSSIGGVCVALFPKMLSQDCVKVLNDSRAKFLFVEDGEQLKKITSINKQLKNLKQVSLLSKDNFVTHFGTFDKFHENLIHFQDLNALGENETLNTDEEFENIINSVQPDDIYSISYTSNFSPSVRGVVITFDMVFKNLDKIAKRFSFKIDDINQPTLSKATRLGALELILSIHVGWHSYLLREESRKKGFFPKQKPTILFCRTLSLEEAFLDIQSLVDEKHPFRRKLMEKVIKMGMNIKSALGGKKLLIFVNMIVYYIVKNLFIIGFLRYFDRRLRFIMIEGGFANPRLVEFYSALGIQIINTYGLKEFFGIVAANQLERFSTDTRCIPFDGIECKVDQNSEIFLRGDGIFSNYYNENQKTATSFKDGWFATGDLGSYLNGGVQIFGRIDSMITLLDGQIIFPESLESRFSFGRFINRVLVFGKGKSFLTAIVTLNRDITIKYARVQGIYFSDFKSLCENDVIYELVKRRIRSVNSRLEKFQRIENFYILDKSFSIESGELAPSYKINRKFCYEKYRKIFESLY